jgi:hypothetical protein
MLKNVFFVLMFLPVLIFADTSKGEKLLNRFWRDMKEGRVEAIKKYTSPKFQSVHYDGARTKAQELNLIANLHMTSYALTQVKITKEHNVFIISYFAQVTETINGLPITSNTPRLTIFKDIHDSWKLVAHANLSVPLVATSG